MGLYLLLELGLQLPKKKVLVCLLIWSLTSKKLQFRLSTVIMWFLTCFVYRCFLINGLVVHLNLLVKNTNTLLFWLPGILDKFILFSSSGNDNVYSS